MSVTLPASVASMPKLLYSNQKSRYELQRSPSAAWSCERPSGPCAPRIPASPVNAPAADWLRASPALLPAAKNAITASTRLNGIDPALMAGILFRRGASLCATAYIPGGPVRLILLHVEPAQREASAGREQRAGRAAARDLPRPPLRAGAGRARVRRGAV